MEAVGVGRRAVAVIIDSILLMVVGWALALVMGGASGSGFNLEGAPAFVWFAIAFGYYIVMEATTGATIGKKVMGIKVVKVGGGTISWGESIIRNLLRLIDGFFFYLVGAIVIWVSKSKQRLGDMAAKTQVVRAGG